jgi:hypothetical protein
MKPFSRIYKGWPGEKKATLLQESREVHCKKKGKPSNIYKDYPYEERKPFSRNPHVLNKRIKETVYRICRGKKRNPASGIYKGWSEGKKISKNLEELTKTKRRTLLQESTRVAQKEKINPGPWIYKGWPEGKRRPFSGNLQEGLTRRKKETLLH